MNESKFYSSLGDTNFDTIVATDQSFQDLLKLSISCRDRKIALVSGKVTGVSGLIFNDFGGSFTVTDIDGEDYKEVCILKARITVALFSFIIIIYMNIYIYIYLFIYLINFKTIVAAHV